MAHSVAGAIVAVVVVVVVSGMEEKLANYDTVECNGITINEEAFDQVCIVLTM